MNRFKELLEGKSRQINEWAASHVFSLVIFNVILIFMLLLRSVGYFSPFLPLTTNIIVMTSFILAVLLFNINSTFIFIAALIFWLFAAFLKIIGVDIWAERTSLYVFELLVIGMVLLVVESIRQRRSSF